MTPEWKNKSGDQIIEELEIFVTNLLEGPTPTASTKVKVEAVKVWLFPKAVTK